MMKFKIDELKEGSLEDYGYRGWNTEYIMDFLKQLKDETKIGRMRIVPIKFVYENLRTNKKILHNFGLDTKRQFLKAGKKLGIKLRISTNKCTKNTINGTLQVHFY